MSSLKDKVVLITGASSGIGEETAIQFASLGSCVVLNGRNLERLHKAAEKCENVGLSKDKILIAQGDVSNEEDANGIVDKTVETFGKLDVLVNSAGIFGTSSILKSTLADFDLDMKVNVRGVVVLTQRAAPHLIKSKGNIVNVSSLFGHRPVSSCVFYCMSKASLNMLTACLSQDLGAKGVRVNAVSPAVTDTPIITKVCDFDSDRKQKFLDMQKWLVPIGRYAKVDEVAKVITFLASDDAAFINGALLPVDGGRSHLTPTAATGPIM